MTSVVLATTMVHTRIDGEQADIGLLTTHYFHILFSPLLFFSSSLIFPLFSPLLCHEYHSRINSVSWTFGHHGSESRSLSKGKELLSIWRIQTKFGQFGQKTRQGRKYK